MISLLRQRTDKGSIVTSNKDLCSKLLDESPQTAPYLNLIKETKRTQDANTTSMSDFISCNTETKSNLTLKTTTEPNPHPARNSVMFNIPPLRQQPNQLSIRRDFNASSTNASSAPTLTSNNNYPHEKKRLSRKKLRHVQQQLENRLSVKSAGACDLYKELNKVLEAEKSLKTTIRERIADSERDRERKREIIYKNWYRDVYEPIQDGIYNMMLSTDAEYARRLRNVKYLEYLDQTNKRVSVFQDDFEPSEYDPIHLMNLNASVQRQLIDPTTLAQRKGDREMCLARSEVRLPTIRRVDSPRSDVVWNNWILDQYNTIDSPVRAKSAKKCCSERHLSEYNLEWDRGGMLRANRSVEEY